MVFSARSGRVAATRSLPYMAVAFSALLLYGCGSRAALPGPTATLWTPIALNPLPSSTPQAPSAAATFAGTLLPTLAPIAPITDADWTRGPSDAAITLLVYSDYQCASCAELDAVIAHLQRLHPQDLRFVFRNFPLLTLYDKTSLASQAAASAASQGDYWAMHELLYSRRSDWAPMTPEQFIRWLPTAAQAAGLDSRQLADDLASRRFEPLVAEAYNRAVAEGIPGAPFLFFNRDLMRFPPTLENLEANVRLTLLARQQFAAYPPMQLQPGADYHARLRLNVGEISLDLFEDTAPLAVNSFVFLAINNWYDGTSIYRVVPGQYVEAGDPSGTGFGTPGYVYELETTPARTFSRPGIVGIASEDPSALGSRFFISFTPLPLYDASRTILGEVTSGLDRLETLAQQDPLSDLLAEPEAIILDVIIEVR